MRQLTVRELIELLKSAPQDLPVKVEGCDCFQEAGGVSVEPSIQRIEVGPWDEDGYRDSDWGPAVLITKVRTHG